MGKIVALSLASSEIGNGAGRCFDGQSWEEEAGN